MNLFGIDPSSQASPMFTFAGENRKAAETTDSGESTEPHGVVMKSSNMMAGSFVHAGREESRYITGMKEGLKAQNSFLNQMQAIVAGYRNLVEISGDPSYAKDAVTAVESLVDDEVDETNNEKIEEIREDIEEKAEEAVAPESQKVLENDASPQEELEDSLDEAAPETQAEAQDEQAITTPEPNAEPVTAAPETGQTEAAAPENNTEQGTAAPQESPGEAPATPSIDIIV